MWKPTIVWLIWPNRKFQKLLSLRVKTAVNNKQYISQFRFLRLTKQIKFKFCFCLILRYKASLTVLVYIYDIFLTWWATMSTFPRTFLSCKECGLLTRKARITITQKETLAVTSTLWKIIYCMQFLSYAMCSSMFFLKFFVHVLYSYFEKGCRKKCARDNPER